MDRSRGGSQCEMRWSGGGPCFGAVSVRRPMSPNAYVKTPSDLTLLVERRPIFSAVVDE